MMNDGGPVFPDPAPLEDGKQGMSLRDYFAGEAMKGLLAGRRDSYDQGHRDYYGGESYKLADAMLEARKEDKDEVSPTVEIYRDEDDKTEKKRFGVMKRNLERDGKQSAETFKRLRGIEQ